MKKLLLTIVLLLIVISGCSNEFENTEVGFTLRSAINAFENEGAEIDLSTKPMYELVNAKDGVLFYHDDELVKLYEFESEQAYEEGVEGLSILGTFPKRDLVVIETDSDRCIEIFEKADE